MALNLYHKVLLRLYEVTGGKDLQSVDLKDLVKSLGFLGSYPEIFQFLSIQGWIMETSKADYVKITHWGTKEAKKTLGGEQGSDANLSNKAEELIKKVREMLINAEGLKDNTTVENLEQVETNIDELKHLVKILKSNF